MKGGEKRNRAGRDLVGVFRKEKRVDSRGRVFPYI